MIRVALGIPTINRSDLLLEALQTYDSNWTDRHIYIVDNGKQEIPTKNPWVEIHRPLVNLGVGSSWNWIMKKAFGNGYTHVALLNDDIVWKKSIGQIENYIKENEAGLYVSGGTWCCFIVSYDTFTKVGGFDEAFFPAYFEDNDYCYRCRLLGIERSTSPFFSPEIYRNSMTIEKDGNLNQNFDTNKQKFILKWGGEPGKEKFKTPFNIGYER
jgi:GT2 family glycosyltransferase